MREDRSRKVSEQTFIAGLLTLCTAAALAPHASAQQPQPGNAVPSPRLLVLSPNGGKAGSTVEVTVTGQDIDDPDSLLFSLPGLKAELIQPPEPTKPDGKAPPQQTRRRGRGAPATSIKFKVTIPADAPVGIHDLRLVTDWGVSNPRAFVVGDLNEVLEKEANNDVPQAQRVDINHTINGAITSPTDVDYFVFAGKKGQRVVLSCLASTLDSRLQSAIELYDSAGRALGFNRNYQDRDSLLEVTLPSDGDYYVRLYEFTHTLGTAEHFYRLSISTAPWIDAIYPPMVEPGKAAQVTVHGRNLPDGQPDSTAVLDGRVLDKLTITVNAPSDPLLGQRLAYNGFLTPSSSGLDGFEYRLRNAAGVSNPFLLTYARAPVVLDNGSNDKPENAQEITLPCEIAGRVEKRHDRDWYTFNAKKGDVCIMEVLSERLGCQNDMYFTLRRLDNKQVIGEFDDTTDTLSPTKWFTRSEDPAPYRFVAPADGKYALMASSRDADIRAHPRLYYRVRITPEQPDFRLVVMPPDDHNPEGCVVRQGGNEYCSVLIWRQDGFNGEVTLTVEGLPEGITCAPQVLGKGLKQTALVFSSEPDAEPWTGAIRVKGTATINGREVVREARPASITWPIQPQQNIPALGRLDRNLVLAVRDEAPFRLAATVDKPAALQGQKINVKLKLSRHWAEMKTPLQVTGLDLPPNLTFNNNQPLTMQPGKDEATAVIEFRGNLTPGIYNLVLRGQTQFPFSKDPTAKQKQNIIVVQPSAPLTLTVLPKQVASVTVGSPNVTLKVGAQAEVVVKVARMNDFTGEFKVQLVLPANTKGVTVNEATIPAGKDEAKVVLRAAANAAPGNLANLVVRATALFPGNVPVTQESKINVNVTK